MGSYAVVDAVRLFFLFSIPLIKYFLMLMLVNVSYLVRSAAGNAIKNQIVRNAMSVKAIFMTNAYQIQTKIHLYMVRIRVEIHAEKHDEIYAKIHQIQVKIPLFAAKDAK